MTVVNRPIRRTLITGGIRSGKSARAETLLGHGPAVYLATGPTIEGDGDWARRVQVHKDRRPASWWTIETTDPVEALGQARNPLLLDDLGSWLVAAMDDIQAWSDRDVDEWQRELHERVDALVDAIATTNVDIVVVTSEVGLTLVADNRAGRHFQDELGYLNQQVAQVCDRVELVIAGCPLTVKGTTTL